MKNPVGTYEALRSQILRYLNTRYNTRWNELNEERAHLINNTDLLCKEPLMEPLPRYVSSGVNLDTLHLADIGLEDDEKMAFVDLLDRGLLSGWTEDENELHQHQLEMLQTVKRDQRHCLITSGTGSGKTEAFLMPLLAQLVSESANWNQPGEELDGVDDWWRGPRVRANEYRWVSQRGHENPEADGKKTAVRALLIYPMNALVEDQLTRLRVALDSDPVREWYDEHCPGHKFYFGRYTGKAPVAGHWYKPRDDIDGPPDPENREHWTSDQRRQEKMRLAMRELSDSHDIVNDWIEQVGGDEREERRDVRKFFQRIDGSEMRSRWDMIDKPPDIMVTNFSMLQIMLMRDVESRIFDETRQWIEENEDAVFHLILDELHLYRGTAGTEVAFLIRLLINRLGLDEHPDRLRIMASSASFGEDDQPIRDFLQDFFGIDGERFTIIHGDEEEIGEITGDDHLPMDLFSRLGGSDPDSDEESQALDAIIEHYDADSMELALLNGVEFNNRLRDACRLPREPDNTRTRAVTLRRLAEIIFGLDLDEQWEHNNPEAWNGMKGLLKARGEAGVSRDLLSLRTHLFLRNINGLSAVAEPDRFVAEEHRGGGRPVGRILPLENDQFSHGGETRRAFELLYCECCGAVFLSGNRNCLTEGGGAAKTWEMLPMDSDLEGIPERQPSQFVNMRNYNEMLVFWPFGELERGNFGGRKSWKQPRLDGQGPGVGPGQHWHHATLNPRNGIVEYLTRRRAERHDPEETENILGFVFRLPSELDRQEEYDEIIGLPAVCPACETSYAWRKRGKRSPIHSFRTGYDELSQVMVKELFLELGEDNRKLVAFSDSREAAASLALRIEQRHFTNLIREIIFDVLSDCAFGEPELVSSIMEQRAEEVDWIDLQYTGDQDSLIEKYSTGAGDRLNGRWCRLIDESNRIGFDGQPVPGAEDAIQFIQSVLQRRESGIIPLNILLGGDQSLLPDSELPLLSSILVTLGINPGGIHPALQRYPHWQHWRDQNVLARELGNHRQDAMRRWPHLFEWGENIGLRNVPPLFEFETNVFWPLLRQSLKRGVFDYLFSPLFYSIEASGLGHATVDRNDGFDELAAELGVEPEWLLEVTGGLLRMLGDRNRFKATRHEFDQFETHPAQEVDTIGDAGAHLRNWVNRCAAAQDVDPDLLRRLLAERCIGGGSVLHNAHHYGLMINPQYLSIKVVRDEDQYYRCENCRRIHLHRSGGICTNSACLSPLPEAPVADSNCGQLRRENYYSEASINPDRKPIRIHTEELTGQTDDQLSRQRAFRNVIVDGHGEQGDTYSKVDEIDVLSVTTTMEVGVDIGALSAVFLANMPPMRFNYQQRVGRAGRRGQPFSMALTLCRQRSHDATYYANLEAITGDEPPLPFLTTDNFDIASRMMMKACLREAFLHAGVSVWDCDEPRDTHGEFGMADFWTDHAEGRAAEVREGVTEWMQGERVILLADAICSGLRVDEPEHFRDRLVHHFRENAIVKLDRAANEQSLGTDHLAHRLAEIGFMPMFGMPTRVRVMYHQVFPDGERNWRKPKSIDRELDLAIYEFAPGSRKTKDKKIYTSVGITAPLVRQGQGNNFSPFGNPFTHRGWMLKCRPCTAIIGVAENREELPDVCDHCDSDREDVDPQENKLLKEFEFGIPSAFRTNYRGGDDDAWEFSGGRSSGRVSFFPPGDPTESEIIGPEDSIEINLYSEDRVWLINEGEGDGFDFHIVNNQAFPDGYAGQPQFIEESYRSEIHGYDQEIADAEERVVMSLASGKVTDVFTMNPHVPIRGIELDPLVSEYDDLRSSRIRSAYYSASFLIRSAFAHRWDLDPEEIEVGHLGRKVLRTGRGDQLVGKIVLNDSLANGSGLCRWLTDGDNLASILEYLLRCPEERPEDESLVGLWKYSQWLNSEDHRCDGLCPQCLQNFSNMRFHGILDWRNGISLLRTLWVDGQVCGLNGDFSAPEMEYWIDESMRMKDQFLHSFTELEGHSLEELGGDGNIARLCVLVKEEKLRLNQHAELRLIIHPLWSTQSPDGILAQAIAFLEEFGDRQITEKRWTRTPRIVFHDTFNMRRRPNWTYANPFTRE